MVWLVLALVTAGLLLRRALVKRRTASVDDLLNGDQTDSAAHEGTMSKHVTADEGIQVVCVAVTAARQDWRSLATGRRYDVLSLNGLRNAQPGSKGLAVMTKRGWRIYQTQDDA